MFWYFRCRYRFAKRGRFRHDFRLVFRLVCITFRGIFFHVIFRGIRFFIISDNLFDLFNFKLVFSRRFNGLFFHLILFLTSGSLLDCFVLRFMFQGMVPALDLVFVGFVLGCRHKHGLALGLVPASWQRRHCFRLGFVSVGKFGLFDRLFLD